MRTRVVLMGFLAASPGVALAQAPDVTVLTASCATCHGPGLEGSGPMPALKGRPAADLATAVKQMQTGERPSTVMMRLSKGWSAAEIDAVAAKIAEMK
ncbi:MAG: c-type cytochrome [Alphaproteobacteria bacterium]|nr:c-type cytochrome [Alphaproteobacteria bacterium]